MNGTQRRKHARFRGTSSDSCQGEQEEANGQQAAKSKADSQAAMHSRSRRDHGAAQATHRRAVGPMSSSTDTSGSSSHGEESQPPPASEIGGVQLPVDNLKDFKERVDSTIQQLSGLVSILTSREAAFRHDGGSEDRVGGVGTGAGRRQQQSNNTSNGGDAPCCACRCHSDGSCSQAVKPSPPLPRPSGGATPTATRRQAAARKPGPAAAAAVGFVSGGDSKDGAHDFAAPATTGRRKAMAPTTVAVAGASAAKPPPQPRQASNAQHRSGSSLAESPTSGGIQFLYYDSVRKRYSVTEAELICAKSVKRLHLHVHYFRVAGEDLLLLEKDCSDDGLAFLDVDSVVAFDGLNVEKVLKLQKIGCLLRPEELSREFAVEKGRSKFYVVPVEEADGDWRLCADAGARQLQSLKRVLEQREVRRGGSGGAGADSASRPPA